MKILLLARSTLFTQPGGDTLQIQQTAHYLQKKGCITNIGLSGQKLKIEDYDVVHFFNLFRPADLMPYLSRIKKLVVTTIYINYVEYDSKYRGKNWARAYSYFGKFGVEYLKSCLRWIRRKDRFPGFYFLLRGQRASIRTILNRADYFITATHQEARSIGNDFDIFNSKRYSKVGLGSEHFITQPLPTANERKGIACVARIEGIKNQLNLIRAVRKMDCHLHLYGNTAANQSSYFQRCKTAAAANIHFEGFKSSEELAGLLPQYKVHAMPSFYETTGLATIEALKAGCQVVITRRGGQEEIFGDHAFYCDPASPSSIRKAVARATESNSEHSKWVKETFSWEKAAGEILDIYRSLEQEK